MKANKQYKELADVQLLYTVLVLIVQHYITVMCSVLECLFYNVTCVNVRTNLGAVHQTVAFTSVRLHKLC